MSAWMGWSENSKIYIILCAFMTYVLYKICELYTAYISFGRTFQNMEQNISGLDERFAILFNSQLFNGH